MRRSPSGDGAARRRRSLTLKANAAYRSPLATTCAMLKANARQYPSPLAKTFLVPPADKEPVGFHVLDALLSGQPVRLANRRSWRTRWFATMSDACLIWRTESGAAWAIPSAGERRAPDNFVGDKPRIGLAGPAWNLPRTGCPDRSPSAARGGVPPNAGCGPVVLCGYVAVVG